MNNLKIQPWHLIVAGIAIFLIFQFGLLPFLGATYDLTDPATNATYACNTTMDCYNALTINGTTTGPPALACSSNTCVFAECVDGDTEKINCPGGTSVTVRECDDGIWKALSPTCPPTECSKSSDCVMSSDVDCDGELEAVTTSCSNYKCTRPSTVVCSDMQLFWGKYKLLIISIVLVAAGIGAFFYAGSRKLW